MGRPIVTRRTAGAAALLALAAGIAFGVAGNPAQDAKLLDPNGASDDVLGTSVGVSGDTAIAGAPQRSAGRGKAAVFSRTGAGWRFQATLAPDDAVDGDFFGNSVAISGDTAVVGAPERDSATGRVVVFTRTGTTWTQQAKFVSEDCLAADHFGWSVALEGDTLVVGAVTADSNHGAAYVFTRSGTTWKQQAKLSAGDAAADDQFGFSIALAGDTAVVGAFQKEASRGAAYVFTRTGTVWSQQSKLQALDGVANDYLGFSVAVAGDTAVAGAYGADAFQGAAYVFTRTGSVWTQQAKLAAPVAANTQEFGEGVAVAGDTVVAGGPAVGSSAGAAHVFTRTGTVWTDRATLTAADGAEGDQLGTAVALAGDTAVAGALESGNGHPGAAYVFDVADAIATPPIGYCLPSKVSAKPNAGHPEKSTLTASGVLDTGILPSDYGHPATFDVGGFHLDVPAFVRKGRTYRYGAGGITLTITTSKIESSRSTFSVKAVGDFAGKVDLGAPLGLHFTNSSHDLRGSANPAGGARVAVTPELAVLAAAATIKGGGKDSLRLTLGFATDGVVPDSGEDLTICFGDSYTSPPIAARSFVRKRNTYVHTSKAPGITRAVVDYAKGTITVSGNGLDLGAFSTGGVRVTIAAVRGGKVRTASILMPHFGTKLSY